MDHRERWVTEQVAYYWKVSKSTVHYWREMGKLAGIRIGKRWTYDPQDVRELDRSYDRRSIPKSDHQLIADRYRRGETYANIGADYGVTRERVRQVIKDTDPAAIAVKKRVAETAKITKQEEREWEKLQSLAREAIARDLRCVVCGAWVLRTRRRPGREHTCSTEHADAWLTLRSFDEHEEHRRHAAQAILNNADHYDSGKIERAKAVVAGKAPPPNRRFFVPGSKRAQIIKKYRPEEFKAIVESDTNHSTLDDYE